MKKLLLLCLVVTSLLRAESTVIDERKVDLYYANGIMMQDDEETAEGDWQDRVDNLLTSYPQLRAKIGKTDVAYNISNGLVADMWEAFMQKVDLEPSYDANWKAFKLLVSSVRYVGKAAELIIAANETASDMLQHDGTLNGQVSKYKESIKAGHGVVVVAHSQGNLFTLEAFKKIEASDAWMLRYLHTIAVATPAASIPNGGNGVTFYNDMINLVPTAMDNKINNPNKHDYIEVTRNAVDGIVDQELLTDQKSIQYHSFEYYLGYPVFEKALKEGSTSQISNAPRQTDNAKTIILAWLYDEIVAHFDNAKQPSQWKITQEDTYCTSKACSEKKVYVTHVSESYAMNEKMSQTLVYPFNSNGKLYSVAGGYVKGGEGGEKIIDNPSDGICFALGGTDETISGEGKADDNTSTNAHSIDMKSGAINATLAWSNAADIDMDLSLDGPNAQQDVKDVENTGIEHAYVASEFDIFPNTNYSVGATGARRSGSSYPESCLEENPITIYAEVSTPDGSKSKAFYAHDYASLNLGTIAEIEVTEKIMIPVLPDSGTSYGGGIGSGGSGITVMSQCNEAEKTKSCGCVPCEYVIRGMKNAVEYGPIGGATVEIVAADNYGVRESYVYIGQTTVNKDLFKVGLIELTKNDKEKIDSSRYYVVSARGGKDIDRDDDLIRDTVPTINKGTIHAIIKGSDLKELSFRVNALTEAAFQVSGDLLGNGYDEGMLHQRLDEIAKRLFKKKTYVFDNEFELNYHDVILWAPAVNKTNLLKDYDLFVEPIVEKTYRDEERVRASNTLIYGEGSSEVVQPLPTSFAIPSDLQEGSVIGMVKLSDQGGKPIDHIELNATNSSAIAIDNKGVVYLKDIKLLDINHKNIFGMKAFSDEGKFSVNVDLTIEIQEALHKNDVNGSIPYLKDLSLFDIEENIEGGLAAKLNFVDEKQSIASYKLSGTDANMFQISIDGSIYVADGVVLDYEYKSRYAIEVYATNDSTNQSYHVPIYIGVQNTIDTPLYGLTTLVHVEENCEINTVVGQVSRDREGITPVNRIDILNPDVPFSIDKNGTITTVGHLNFEQMNEYHLVAVARTESGDSNRFEIDIIIDDQYPEIGIPIIEGFDANVSEGSLPGSAIGKIQIDSGAVPVSDIKLYGQGHHTFNVDINGTIYLAEQAQLDYETINLYRLTVMAINDRGVSNSAEVTLHIQNRNDTPPKTYFTELEVPENSKPDSVIGIVMFNPGESEIGDVSLEGDGSGNFVIEKDGTIKLSSTADLDFEKRDAYQLMYTMSNIYGNSQSHININVKNIAETLPVLKSVVITQEFQDFQKGKSFANILVDSGDTKIVDINFTQVSPFSINKAGDIVLSAELDPNILDYSLYATAQNEYGVSKPVLVQINVVVYEKPILKETTLYVNENIIGGAVAGKIDIVTEGLSAIESFIVTGSSDFIINQQGEVSVSPNVILDFEKKYFYKLQVLAHNSYGDSDQVELNIIVNNIPEIAPTLRNIDATYYKELKIGDVLGNLLVDHGDTGITHMIYTLETPFSVDNMGNIFLTSEIKEDETAEYILEVEAYNAFGRSNKATLRLSVQLLPIINGFTTLVHDQITNDDIVGNISVVSSGYPSINGFSLDNNDTFTIDSNGTIRLKEGVTLDYHLKNHYELNATATNAQGNSLPGTVVIDLKTTPTVESLDLTLLDGLIGGTKIGQLNIKENGTQIVTVALSGLGSEDINITKEGALFIANDAKIRASEQAFYELYVLVNGERLATLNITVQNRIVATLDTIDNAAQLAIDKNSSVAYVADNNYYGAAIVDFSQKDRLSFVGRTSGNNGSVSGIAINEVGSKLVAGSYKKMELFDTEDSLSPLYLDTYSIENYFNFIEILPLRKMVLVGTYDYIDILKIEDNGTLGSSYKVYAQNSRGAVVSSDEKYMFVSGNYESIDIYDIRDLAQISQISTIPVSRYRVPMRLSEDNRYLFVIGESLLQVYDLQEIMQPKLLSSLTLPETITTLSSDANNLYLGGSQLHVVDTADVTALELLGSITVPGGIKDVALLGNADQAIVASGNSGIHLVNVGGFEHQEKVPGILPFEAAVEADASINTVVGQAEVVYSGSGITSFSLAGEGAEKFSIDTSGTVRVVSSLLSGPALYQLQMNVSNSVGTRVVDAAINVHSVPAIAEFNGSINSMSSAGTVVGSLDLGVDDANSIEAISLNGDGSEYFQVNKSGEITFSGGIELHHFSIPAFTLSVEASNRYGQSEPAAVIVNVSALVSETELSKDPKRAIQSIKFSEDGRYADVEMYQGYDSMPQYVTRVDIQDLFSLSIVSQESIDDTAQKVEFPANVRELMFDEDNKTMVVYAGEGGSELVIYDAEGNQLSSYSDYNNENGEYYFDINHMQLLSDNSSLLFGGSYWLGILNISADRSSIELEENVLRGNMTTFALIPHSSFALVGDSNVLKLIDLFGSGLEP